MATSSTIIKSSMANIHLDLDYLYLHAESATYIPKPAFMLASVRSAAMVARIDRKLQQQVAAKKTTHILNRSLS